MYVTIPLWIVGILLATHFVADDQKVDLLVKQAYLTWRIEWAAFITHLITRDLSSLVGDRR